MKVFLMSNIVILAFSSKSPSPLPSLIFASSQVNFNYKTWPTSLVANKRISFEKDNIPVGNRISLPDEMFRNLIRSAPRGENE